MIEGYWGEGPDMWIPMYAYAAGSGGAEEAQSVAKRGAMLDRLVRGVESGEFTLVDLKTTKTRNGLRVELSLARRPDIKGEATPRRRKRPIKKPPKAKRELIFDDD